MAQKTYSDYSKDEMLQLTQGVIGYLDGWQLSAEQMMVVLGLDKVAKTVIFKVTDWVKGVSRKAAN